MARRLQYLDTEGGTEEGGPGWNIDTSSWYKASRSWCGDDPCHCYSTVRFTPLSGRHKPVAGDLHSCLKPQGSHRPPHGFQGLSSPDALSLAFTHPLVESFSLLVQSLHSLQIWVQTTGRQQN
ncbi:hypothetical protein E2C01_052774 [Portunus trituberculatus]|uniref:Uncharacterized protein n=1 Tax=Portunus trituberculatus TaxID=210409 RepID=A0A5B7GMR9_PORTR|nr:hypothetical protein [Portunus trituberculatus]